MNRLIGVAALSGLLVLGACGGGGDGPVVSEAQLGLDYSNTAEERHSTAYETGSYAYTVERGDAATLVYIGGDLEPRENLTHVWTDNGIRYFMGASRDGVGVDRLQDYEKDLTTQAGTIHSGWRGMTSSPSAAGRSCIWTPTLRSTTTPGSGRPCTTASDPERCLAPGVSDRDKGHPRHSAWPRERDP